MLKHRVLGKQLTRSHGLVVMEEIHGQGVAGSIPGDGYQTRQFFTLI